MAVGAVVVGALLGLRCGVAPPTPPAPPAIAPPALAPPTPTGALDAHAIDKSPEQQRRRREFIQRWIDQGVFAKTEAPVAYDGISTVTAWVRAAFYGLDFDLKQRGLADVYAYYYTRTDTPGGVRLRDAVSGQDVGFYAPVLGLQLK